MLYLTSTNRYFPVLQLLALLALSLVLACPLHGQVAGATLSGTVTDASGAAIPNARVSIKNTATGVIRDVTTDSAGFYSAPNLLPGNYDVTTSAQGFSTQVHTGITLTVGASQVLDLSLQVGQVNQTVEVTGAAPTVQLTSSTISAEVNARTVRELPLNGRDWTQLAILQPGVVAVRAQASTSSISNRGTRGFGNQLSAVGHSPYENNYRINGITVNDYSNGSPGSVLGGQVGVDGIQEFSVLTTNNTAEYGRSSGGVINAITKSGTNTFHGSAYWFLRNEHLDARNFFDPAQIPPFRRNEFGASGGGPIKKDKTFIFANYEGIRQNKSLAFHDTVPTAAARAGRLCSVPTTSACTPNALTVSSLVAPFLGLWPMPNAGLTPSGNGDTGFFDGVGAARASENYETVRGDHRISDKDSLAASWFLDQSSLTQPDALLVGVHEVASLRQMASLEWTHVFSPSVVNTARVGYSRTHGVVQKPVSAINPLGNDHSLGAIPGNNAPALTVPGLTTMQGALGDPIFLNHVLNSYQAYDDAFITRGTHAIKIGFALEHLQNNVLALNTNGKFSFPSLQGFLLNQPTSGSISDPNLSLPGTKPGEIGLRQTLFGGYVHDDWRARPNLVLNLGLRYEPTTIISEARSRLALMQNFYSGGATINLSQVWHSNPTLRNFEPRVGFAWDPFHNGKTAVRGGFGIFDVLPLPSLIGRNTAPFPPFLTTFAVGNLPAGSFPTGLRALVVSDPTKIQGRFVELNPHRNYAMNWNLNVQRQITPSWTAMVGYVGSRTVHQNFFLDDEDMVLPTLTSAGYLWPFPVKSGTRFNTSVGAIASSFWDGSASYEGLQAQLTKRLSHGVQVQGAYTWGKCLDTGSSPGSVNNFLNSLSGMMFFNRLQRRGQCDFQVAHSFAMNWVWQLPTPKSWGAAAAHILGGWQVGGIVSASTGSPFSVIVAGDSLGQNSTNTTNFPNRVSGSGCNQPVNPRNVNNYLKLNCFTPPIAPAEFASRCQPAAASVAAVIPNTCMNLFGNAGRNQILGPGLQDIDFSLFKNNYVRRISESFNIQFRAEFFNILNRANFQSPLNHNTVLNQNGTLVGGAGVIDSTTTDARQIQFGLKLIW